LSASNEPDVSFTTAAKLALTVSIKNARMNRRLVMGIEFLMVRQAAGTAVNLMDLKIVFMMVF
jgi:hypothetical protein